MKLYKNFFHLSCNIIQIAIVHKLKDRYFQYLIYFFKYFNIFLSGPNQPYPSPTQNYPNNVQQPLHINPNSRQDDRQEVRYNNVGGGLLREDVFRQSQNSRHDEMMRLVETKTIFLVTKSIPPF